jgi:hypothetical protein
MVDSPDGQNERLKPIAFVQVIEKSQIRCLVENPLLTRVSGVFCTTKDSLIDVYIRY